MRVRVSVAEPWLVLLAVSALTPMQCINKQTSLHVVWGSSYAEPWLVLPAVSELTSPNAFPRRRPFHPTRLREVILQLPVTGNSEGSGAAEQWAIPDGGVKGEHSPMQRVIRSKG